MCGDDMCGGTHVRMTVSLMWWGERKQTAVVWASFYCIWWRNASGGWQGWEVRGPPPPHRLYHKLESQIWPKLGRIRSKWDNFEIFKDLFTLYFESPSKSDLVWVTLKSVSGIKDLVRTTDVKFSIQIGSDWQQMGRIWNFLRSAGRQNVLKLILKIPRFVIFRANLTKCWCQI